MASSLINNKLSLRIYKPFVVSQRIHNLIETVLFESYSELRDKELHKLTMQAVKNK